jgi:acyl carrier protein
VGPVFLGFVGGAAFATFPPLVGSARPRHPLRETTTMNRTDLSAIVLELLEKETGESYPGLEEATTLREGLNLDSLDMAGLVLHIESRFGIEIENDLLERIATVGDVLDAIEQKVAAKGGRQAA